MNDQRKKIYGQTRDDERAFYGLENADIENCTFAGPADGESALKECQNFTVRNCSFSLRYPLWHAENYSVKDSRMDVNTRAAVWYSKRGSFENCTLEGIKVFRECDETSVKNCVVSSFESGWKCRGFEISDSKVLSEYFLLAARDLKMSRCHLEGKYFMQYVENAIIEDCEITTKDCLWHAKNVTAKNCVFHGEYLGWYSENLTLIDCVIDGTQPLCYCKKLKLVNCRMLNCDFSFELSEVEADIVGHILSVRSPLSGTVTCDSLGDLVRDVKNPDCNAKIIVRNKPE